MMATDCEQFQEGTRLRSICEGEADLSIEKINRYRAGWGLPPLDGVEPMPRVKAKPVKRSKIRSPKATTDTSNAKRNGCGGCGGGSGKAAQRRPNGWGPGSQLLAIFAQAGMPHCDECITLAGQMDRWGRVGCTKKLGQLVDDILPRAREWLTENRPIVHKFLSIVAVEDFALKKAIRSKVEQAIDNTPDRRPRREIRPRAKREPRRSDDLSNLIESTAIGSPTWTKGTHPTVERIPFVGEPIRNLIYHVYPHRDSDMWRWNVDMILQRIDLFNGRRVVAIAVGDETESAETVKDRFGSEVVEYMVFRNNKQAGEMSSFVPLLAQMESDDPNQVTFRAHTKGVVRCQKNPSPHFRDWAEMLYRTNLEDWPLVQQHLEAAAMTGSCRKFDQFSKRKPTGKPSYSGTFYWFRNCFVFSRDWQVVDTPRWGCESWPAKMFSAEETRCLCLDNTGSMYSAAYWKSTAKPEYEKWLRERELELPCPM